MISKKLLRNEERAILTLRALYRKHGFLPHKMNKFEEYEFYIENKDFLMADRIATFYDTNGKLMALRPDVTLSIIKNNEFIPGVKQRVYYDESVYRAYGSSRQIREIKQVGLECVGDLDLFDISETLLLAGESLAKIADDFVISISHLGILNSILQETCTDSEFTRKALNYIKAKNAHDIEKLCMKYRVPEAAAQRLCSFVSLYGRIEEILPQLSLLCTSEEAVEGLEEIKTLYQIIKDTPYKDNFVVDFSIVNDMDYYNNIVFQGFIKGISENILAGGQYDKLLEKMNKESRGIGFGITLNHLEMLGENKGPKGSLDYLILYDNEEDIVKVAAESRRLISEGCSVSVQKTIPKKLRYDSIIDMRRETQ
ncbi:MAG: ATP phosphoribosyltransferase regulatory subunit [Eubacteriaceae bacterium]|nr:ATP phosphoribosyltransferase regulatory subunit [Eubacteriaceae bacterium]